MWNWLGTSSELARLFSMWAGTGEASEETDDFKQGAAAERRERCQREEKLRVQYVREEKEMLLNAVQHIHYKKLQHQLFCIE